MISLGSQYEISKPSHWVKRNVSSLERSSFSEKWKVKESDSCNTVIRPDKQQETFKYMQNRINSSLLKHAPNKHPKIDHNKFLFE